jgi:hypothetical protein
MSEHIQPAPGSHPLPAAPPPHTPGVAHEDTDFNFRLIIWIGVWLAVAAVVIHLAVWWLFEDWRAAKAEQEAGKSALALQDGRRPLGERLLGVPEPRLEGIEPETSLLFLKVEDEERIFFVGQSPDVHINGEKEKAGLFKLTEGQAVTITYEVPNSDVAGSVPQVVALTSPPEKETGSNGDKRMHRLTGTVVRIEPRSIQAMRSWAEAQLTRYGWADRRKGVARIPVALAMEEVLRKKEFQGAGTADKDRRKGLPSRANSGRNTQREKP